MDIAFLGLDINPKSIAKAKNKKSENLNFMCIDFFKFNPKNKFDIIITSEVLEHLENPMDFVLRISFFTKKDGFLIISTPNKTNYAKRFFHFLLGAKAEKIKEGLAKKNKKKPWDERGHISVQGEAELKDKLNKAGFTVIRQTRSQPLYGGKWVDSNFIFRGCNLIIDKILPRQHFVNFGWGLMFLARKK